MTKNQYTHLVISGGSYKGLYIIGTLQYLIKKNIIDIDKLEDIYGISVGSLIGFLLCLKLDIDDLIDYLIQFPWKKIFSFSMNELLEIFINKGFIYKKKFIILFYNLLKKAGLNKDITFKQLYEYSNISFYTYSLNMNIFKLEEFSHIKTPDFKVLDAIYMSCSLPIIFKPLEYNGKLYLDGGLKNDYPLNRCLEYGCKLDETIGIRITDKSKPTIEEDSNILNMVVYLLRMFIINNNNYDEIESDNIINMNIPRNTISAASIVLENVDARKDCVREGKEATEKYLIKKLKKV